MTWDSIPFRPGLERIYDLTCTLEASVNLSKLIVLCAYSRGYDHHIQCAMPSTVQNAPESSSVNAERVYNTTAQIVDDTNSGIAYTTGWSQTFTGLSDFNSSYHVVQKVGEEATFVFNGTGIEVYGFPESLMNGIAIELPPDILYNIDGGASAIYHLNSSAQIKGSPFSVLTYVSPPLTQGEHTLTISCLNTTKSYFGLNYLVYTPGNMTSSGGTQVITVSALVAPTAISSNGNGVSKSAIAGGTIGGVALVALLVLATVFCYKRYREPKQFEFVQPYERNYTRHRSMPSLPAVYPFSAATVIETPRAKGAPPPGYLSHSS